VWLWGAALVGRGHVIYNLEGFIWVSAGANRHPTRLHLSEPAAPLTLSPHIHKDTGFFMATTTTTTTRRSMMKSYNRGSSISTRLVIVFGRGSAGVGRL